MRQTTMNALDRHIGSLPIWLCDRLNRATGKARQYEIEVKFAVPRAAVERMLGDASLAPYSGIQATRQLEQVYVPRIDGMALGQSLHMPDDVDWKEWRVRRVDDEYHFTAKGAAQSGGVERPEFNAPIDRGTFLAAVTNASQTASPMRLGKIRLRRVVKFAGEDVLVEIDDYQNVAGREVHFDFLICEVEVSTTDIAQIIRRGRYFAPALMFLKEGVDVTDRPEFKNVALSQGGFVADTYSGVVAWLQLQRLAEVDKARQLIVGGQLEAGVCAARQAIDDIARMASAQTRVPASHAYLLSQGVLSDLAFRPDDSWGRSPGAEALVLELDGQGKGWLRDFQFVISSDCYIRLHAKPQIFRPGVGFSNTTTRGVHTTDVIVASMQIARQLGLNVDLCAAAAAMHDIGHPAGGHVGEDFIHDRTGRKFQHHVFSLSLTELFGMDLLKEVLTCAYHHKSSGSNLVAPPGMPQEAGVVRIADKISYGTWDLRDSLENGFIEHDFVESKSREYIDDYMNKWGFGPVGKGVFGVLGKDWMEIVSTLIRSVVRESAEAHRVQFTEQSGVVYAAYRAARDIVYKHVHENIRWDALRAQLDMALDKLTLSFPEIEDLVPVLAYITDRELVDLSRIIESEPKAKPLRLAHLRELGFGFCELIDILRRDDFDSSRAYYQSSRLKPIGGV